MSIEHTENSEIRQRVITANTVDVTELPSSQNVIEVLESSNK